jgi:hypothetical protein
VDEINGMVDECHNEGFESGGVLLPVFTSYDTGMCSPDGNNATGDPSEPLAEKYCKELLGYYNESGLTTTCECIAGSDNMTYTFSCQEKCETCDPDSKICGIRSFTELIDPQQGDGYGYGDCFEYTQGSFKGDKVCNENYYSSNGTQGCRISANGVDCSSCEYRKRRCGQQGYQTLRVANCNNVVEIGVTVDDCTMAGLGNDEILAAYFNAYEVGSCNSTETVEVTDKRTEPPEADATEQLTKLSKEGVTSGAKRESQMVVSSVVVAALLFSSLA